jgi:hypothetical protein
LEGGIPNVSVQSIIGATAILGDFVEILMRNLLATEPDPDYLHEWSSQLGLTLMLQECLNE